MQASQSDRERWLAIVLAAALDNDIMTPDDILLHATPEVLAAHLPPDVMSNVLAASLKEGTMNSEVILRTVGPDVLSRYVPPNILWSSVQSAARRAEIAE
jgi:hypothetical protein